MAWPRPNPKHVTKEEYDAFMRKHRRHIRKAPLMFGGGNDHYNVYEDTRLSRGFIAMEPTDDDGAYTIVENADELVEADKLNKQCLKENSELFRQKQRELCSDDYDNWAKSFILQYYEEHRKK